MPDLHHWIEAGKRVWCAVFGHNPHTSCAGGRCVKWCLNCGDTLKEWRP